MQSIMHVFPADSVERMPGLEKVWEALRQTGTTRHAPLLLKHGVCSPQSVAIMGRNLCEDGLPKADLEKILAWLTPQPGVATKGRSDHPVLWQPGSEAGTRASFTLALQCSAEPAQESIGAFGGRCHSPLHQASTRFEAEDTLGTLHSVGSASLPIDTGVC